MSQKRAPVTRRPFNRREKSKKCEDYNSAETLRVMVSLFSIIGHGNIFKFRQPRARSLAYIVTLSSRRCYIVNESR